MKFEINTKPNTLSLNFQGGKSNIERAANTLLGIIKEKELPLNYFDLNVVLLEVISNAVKHGNANDPQKEVQVSFLFKDESFLLTVKDQGEGFCVENATQNKSDVLTPHGMGITIMQAMGYDVSFNKRDCCVKLKKKYEDSK